jgi:hypothetical protein
LQAVKVPAGQSGLPAGGEIYQKRNGLMRSDSFLRLLFLLLWLAAASAGPALAGPYADSAHGDAGSGVRRAATDGLGYVQGNCAHCHEQHTSIGGVEPAPAGGAASPFALFADNFSGKTVNTYNQADDFCFFCHSYSGSLQVGGIINYPYSRTFGGAASSPVSGILAAFNQRSYHNLEDIRNFAATRFSYFKSQSNPCAACHNPHRARRNREHPRDPAYAAISKPTDHENLVTTSMGATFGTEYEPPYCSGTTREPASSASDVAGRAATPDYVSFCTSCHNSINLIYSTNYNRNLQKIDWGGNGDKHGLRDRTESSPSATSQDPYNVNYDYVLSCLDCHEPHGSSNITLIRTRVNGGQLSGSITIPVVIPPNSGTGSNSSLGYLCQRCHITAWKTIHHGGPGVFDAPYQGSLQPCGDCHGNAAGPPKPIDCGKCHFHGSTDAWLKNRRPDKETGRRTF